MTPDELKQRTKDYSLRVIRLCQALPKKHVARTIGDQLLRSATSVGAQYREALRARSREEFISKVQSALQELEESHYWLELIVESHLMSSRRMRLLLKEADELLAILGSSVRTARSRRQK